jgi:triosephosphate isomerase
MNKTTSEATDFVHCLVDLVTAEEGTVIVLAPPFTALQAVKLASGMHPLQLAAQNVHWEERGAFTGEISPPMLTEVGCRYVILGHSERRRLFGESDEDINKKIHSALTHGLRPIVCVGESLDERESGHTVEVITRQLSTCLRGISETYIRSVTIAYEPIWAIGTGRAASPQQAAEVHRAIRDVLIETWTPEAIKPLGILYGGSVTPENAALFFAEREVDGALVGGACLNPHSFAKIIALAKDLAQEE